MGQTHLVMGKRSSIILKNKIVHPKRLFFWSYIYNWAEITLNYL